MNCPVCGKTAEMGARFCSACGHQMFPPEAYAAPAPTRFVRPRQGRMIAGVCAGIAMQQGWDVAIVRLVVALLVLFGCGAPILGYFIAWIVMPNAEFVFPPYHYGAPDSPAPPAPGATVS